MYRYDGDDIHPGLPLGRFDIHSSYYFSLGRFFVYSLSPFAMLSLPQSLLVEYHYDYMVFMSLSFCQRVLLGFYWSSIAVFVFS